MPYLPGTYNPPYVTPIIQDGQLVDVKIHGFGGFRTWEERNFASMALTLLGQGVSSELFKAYALNSSVKYTNGKTVAEVYYLLVSGWCQQFKQKDHCLDFFVNLYKGRRSIIGYTYGFLKVWTNRYHFLKWMDLEKKYPGVGVSKAAAHYCHEYLHMLGFKHPRHRGSLVYEWGYAMEDICKHVFKTGEHEPAFMIGE